MGITIGMRPRIILLLGIGIGIRIRLRRNSRITKSNRIKKIMKT